MNDQVFTIISNEEGKQITFTFELSDERLISLTALDAESNEYDVCLQLTPMLDGRVQELSGRVCCCPSPEGGLMCMEISGTRCPACAKAHRHHPHDDDDDDKY